jgi:Arc/MetJ-type ribon-helix-helix transcriptional regulator
MDYHFPPDLQPYVEEMIARGAYEDVHALILDAVYRHRDLELARRRKYDELKKEIQIGLDQLDAGQSAELNMADIRKRVREHLA